MKKKWQICAGCRADITKAHRWKIVSQQTPDTQLRCYFCDKCAAEHFPKIVGCFLNLSTFATSITLTEAGKKVFSAAAENPQQPTADRGRLRKAEDHNAQN